MLFVKVLFPNAKELSSGNIGFSISPVFNAAGRL